ncbi:hypothetical protein ACLB2K_068611 [Fragaria x ananassa]
MGMDQHRPRWNVAQTDLVENIVFLQQRSSDRSSVVWPPHGVQPVSTTPSRRPRPHYVLRFRRGAQAREKRRREVFPGFAGDFTNPATAADMNGGASFVSTWRTSTDSGELWGSTQVAALSAVGNIVVDFTTHRNIHGAHSVVISSLISDPEPFVQEQALALVRNLVDGCMKSVELVFGEDGIIFDDVGRQLQGASRDEIRVQFLPISFISPYLKYGHKSRNISGKLFLFKSFLFLALDIYH